MRDYIECLECDFVLLAENAADPLPKYHDACPGCRETRFRFTDD